MAKTLVYQMYPIAWEDVHTKEHREWENAIYMMAEHLKRVKELGADYVWLSPFYPSPRCDYGYDITDYQDVDPRLGSLADIDSFIATAHNLGLKVLFDLVLNHTSTDHPWFEEHPEYYCWSDRDRKGWKNLFDGRSAWSYLPDKRQYYLHMFSKNQADLNWFPDGDDGEPNQDLVYEFQRIIGYWSELFGVDGFRLDIPQAINKDFSAKNQELGDLLFGEKALDVINAVFDGYGSQFIIMECMDPTGGELVDHYVNNTPVDFVLNMIIKDEIAKVSYVDIARTIGSYTRNPALMLDLENHDSPRLPSRLGVGAEDCVWWIFNSNAKGICLYQGQELGLKNPTKQELPNDLMLELDVQTAMWHAAGESLDELRPTSRANARIPIPLAEYDRQEQDPSSYLNLTKDWVKRWKMVNFVK